MKIKKLLSILMTMNNSHLDSMNHEEATNQFMTSVNHRYEVLQKYQNSLKEHGIDVNKQRKDLLREQKLLFEDWQIHVSVVDEDGNALCAQVKCYPILKGENLETFDCVNGRIDMILRSTDEKGEVIIEVPSYEYSGFAEGTVRLCKIIGWFIQVEKGSEYEPIRRIYPIKDEEKVIRATDFRLKRFIYLNDLGWVAGDLHHHSIYSSPVHGGTDQVIESAKEVKEAMTAAGLSFGALSDHHNILNHGDWIKTKSSDFVPIISKEISTSNGHVMAMNVKEDIIYVIPKEEDRNFDYLLSEFVRITQQIKEKNGLAQINHPRDMNPAISLSSRMTDHIELFDTMEIWNGSIPFMPGTTNDQAFQLWIELLKEDRFIPATSGSDTHNTRADDYHTMYDELNWLVYHMETEAPSRREPEIEHFLTQFRATSALFEKWAEVNLGTGGVRTYVYCEKKDGLNSDEILFGLKAGKSFMTNGPILIPKIMGKSLGEKIVIGDEKEIIINISLYSNQPLETVTIQSKKGIIKTVHLYSTENKVQCHFEWNLKMVVEANILEKKDWFIFRAFSDHTNQVITNPIFICPKSEE